MLGESPCGPRGRPKVMSEPFSPWSRLRGLEPMSLCDWPGRISAVLFLGGCDLRCPSCHNPGLAWAPENLPLVSPLELQTFLQTDAAWLDGLVITGGEPTLSADLPDWLAELRMRFPLPIKLDSNGMHPEVVEPCLRRNVVDVVAVDVKGPLVKYPLLTGHRIAPERIAGCLERIFDLACMYPGRFLFRCTLVPQLESGDVDEVRRMLPPGYVLNTQPYCKPRKQVEEELPC